MESPEPLVCVCGEPANFRCDWKILRFVKVAVSDIRLGDTVRRLGEENGERQGVATVDRISKNSLWCDITLSIKRERGGRKTKALKALPASLMQAQRPVLCGSPCCPKCHREVWDGRHYCRSHWEAWELSGELDQASAI